MKKRSTLVVISCIAVYFIAILFIFRGYHHTSSSALNQLLYENQKINIQVQQREVISKVEDVHTTLKTMAEVLEECESEEEMRKFDDVMDKMGRAESLSAQGVQYYSFAALNLEKMSEEDRQTIETLRKGEPVMSTIHRSLVDGESYYGIAEPVSLDGEYVGFVRGLIVADTLLRPSESGVFGDDTETYLIHKNGDNALMQYQEDEEAVNLFEIAKSICDEPEKVEELKAEMDQGSESAVIQTTAQGGSLILSCVSLPYNDWMIFNVVHSDTVASYVQRLADGGRDTVLVVGGMAAIVIVFVLVIYYYIGKEQRYEKERASLLANFSDTVLCDYDIKKDSISCTANIKRMFPLKETTVSQFSVYAKHLELVYPEDSKVVKEIITTMPKEGEILDYEIRLKNMAGEYSWYRIDAAALYIKGKTQHQLILKITDIAERKEREQGLMEKAQSDALTGLFNRDFFEEKVREKLEKGADGYLFLLDLDDFKYINDTYGHQIGDETLVKVGQCIRDSFRKEDYVGRYGGDEFLMFMSAPVSELVAQGRAEALIREVSSITLEEYPDFKLTCSVGLVKAEGEGYEQLLKKADRAMYNVKQKGRNSWGIS